MQSSGAISTTYTVENESKWAKGLIQTLWNKPASCSCHGRLMNGQIKEIGWPQAYLPQVFVKVGRTFADKSISDKWFDNKQVNLWKWSCNKGWCMTDSSRCCSATPSNIGWGANSTNWIVSILSAFDDPIVTALRIMSRLSVNRLIAYTTQ